MIGVAKLPHISINCGQVFFMTVTLKDSAGVVVNLTSWTGLFSVSTEYSGAAIVTDVPSLNASGVIMVALTAVQTATLQPYVDSDCLVFQIDVDKNDNTAAHRFQGGVIIYPEIGI